MVNMPVKNLALKLRQLRPMKYRMYVHNLVTWADVLFVDHPE